MDGPTRLRVYRHAALLKIRRALGLPTDPYPPRPPETRLSPSAGLIAATAAAPRALAFDTGNISLWQEKARAHLAALTGYETERAAPALRASTEPVLLPAAGGAGPAVRRTTYYLRVRPECDLPVTLLVADGLSENPPVFLYLAGSTSGVHLGWGDAKVPIDHHRLSIGADIALQAARRGYLAVCIEQIGFGEREERDLAGRAADRTVNIATHALLLGKTVPGLKATDVSAAIDWLFDHSAGGSAPIAVDRDRVYLFGHSSGGSAAQFAAALDPRIRGVLASGSVRRFAEIYSTRGDGSGELVIPNFLTAFETDDVIALTAPRPFVGLSGIVDHIFPYDGVERTVEGARPAYAAFGAADALQAVSAPAGHRYYAPESWAAWKAFIDPGCGDDPAAD